MKKFIFGLVLVSSLFFGLQLASASGSAGSKKPDVMLYADQTNINYGSSTRVYWYVNYYAESCTASGGANGWAGPKINDDGSFQTGPLTSTTTYTLTCQSTYGSDTESVTIYVNGQPPTTPPSVDLSTSQSNINYGDSTILTWVTTGNATSCNATNGTNGWSGAKSISGGNFSTGALFSTTTYTITCSNSGGSASDTVTVSVNQQQNPPTVNLTANPSQVSYGGSTVLNWTVTNATACSANSNPATNWTGSKNSNGGQETVSNLTTTTYFNIFCTGQGGSNGSTITVTVNQQQTPPSVDLSAAQSNVNYGDSTILTWVTTGNATSCNATNGTNGWSGAKSISGGNFSTGALFSTTTYTITCSNSGGSASDTVTVSVNQQQNPPTVDLYASQTTLQYNGSTNLNWNTSNATSCSATGGTNGWSGSKSASGGTFYTGSLTNTLTYSITCSNSQGQTSNDSVTIIVENQNTTPTVSTNSATNVGYNNATLNGYVSANGGNTVNAWFEWGTNSGSMYNQTGQVNYGSTSGTSYNYSLGGLSQNTTYYFRAVAESTSGNRVYGSVLSFTTQNSNTGCTYNCGYQNQPSVTTYQATNIADNNATLNGYVNTNGSSTSVWFEWGTSTSYLYNQTNRNNVGYSSGNFNQYVTGLSPNTTYYFRAVAEGPGGKVYGNILNFYTTGFVNPCGFGNCEPQAVTTLATNVGQNTARLNGLGLSNGNNLSLNGYFEWGQTQSLGQRTTESYIGTSSSNPFYSNISGLTQGVTYYYRAVVTNQYGTSRGDIVSFRTNQTVVIDGGGSSTTNVNVIYRDQGAQNTNIIYRDTSNTNTNTIVRNTTNTNLVTTTNDFVGVSKPSLLFLNISNNGSFLNIGSSVDYFVNYKNVSAENLRDVVIRVVLPKELGYTSTTAGYYSAENNTVVVNIGNLFPAQEGSFVVSVRVLESATIGKVLVGTAHGVYTIERDGLQEEVFAYAKNEAVQAGANLTGTALFGAGFWPTTLIGWLLLLLVIFLILLALRYVLRRV